VLREKGSKGRVLDKRRSVFLIEKSIKK